MMERFTVFVLGAAFASIVLTMSDNNGIAASSPKIPDLDTLEFDSAYELQELVAICGPRCRTAFRQPYELRELLDFREKPTLSESAVIDRIKSHLMR